MCLRTRQKYKFLMTSSEICILWDHEMKNAILKYTGSLFLAFLYVVKYKCERKRLPSGTEAKTEGV